MDLIEKISTLDSKIKNNISELYSEDITLIKKTLSLQATDTVTTCLQEVVIDLIVFLSDAYLTLFDDEMIELLFGMLKKLNHTCFKRIIHIFAQVENKKLDQKIKEFLEDYEKIDKYSVNLAILNKEKIIWKNQELELLNRFDINLITLGLLNSHKNLILQPAGERLYKKLKQNENNPLYYRFFAELNMILQHKNNYLMDVEIEQDQEYVALVYSLMVDSESCIYAFDKLYARGCFSALYNALQSLSYLHKIEERLLLPDDILYIELLLKVIKKLTDKNSALVKIRAKFFSFIDILLETLQTKIPLNTKKILIEILANLCGSEENNNKIGAFLNLGYIKRYAYADYELERVLNSFECTREFLSLCFNFKFLPDLLEFCIYVLSSENPEIAIIVLQIFKEFEFKNFPGNVYKYLREACIKNEDVISEVVNYFVSLQIPIKNVDLTKVVLSVESEDLFKLIEFYEDFSIYLNSDFLNRLISKKREGLLYLINNCEKTSRFVLSNRTWFNDFTKNEKEVEIQKLILKLYSKIQRGEKNCAGTSNMALQNKELEFSFVNPNKILLPTLFCGDLFKIFSNCLIYSYFYKKDDIKEYLIGEVEIENEDLEDYCLYLKCLIAIDQKVNLNYLIQNFSGKSVDDLIGYYRSCGFKIEYTSQSLNNKMLEGLKDNSIFIKNFERCDRFEKFLIFNTLDHSELESDYLQKKEITRILKSEINTLKTENIATTENLLLTKNILVTLLSLDNIDSIVKVLDVIENIPEKFYELLLCVSIHNIFNGGTAFVRVALKKGPVELQAKLVLILFIRGLWTNEINIQYELLKERCRNNDDLKYLGELIK